MKTKTKDKLTRRQPVAGEATVGAMVTKDEVAELLHIHPVTVLRWARLGKLPAERVGKAWLFDRVKIEVEVLHRNQPISTAP